MIRVNGGLSRATAIKLREQCLTDLADAKAEITNGNVDARAILGMELYRKSRSDLFLSFLQPAYHSNTNEYPLLDSLNELLGTSGTLRELYEILVTGE